MSSIVENPEIVDTFREWRQAPSDMTAEVFTRRTDALFMFVGNHDSPRPGMGGGGQNGGPCKMLAPYFGRHRVTISKWRTGAKPIPRWAWTLLNALCAVAELGGREAMDYAVMNAAAEDVVPFERGRKLGLRA